MIRVFVLLPLLSCLLSAGDAVEGKEIFKMCAGCHDVETGQRKMGPSLRSLWGKVTLRNGKRTTDANVTEIIVKGYNNMPAYENMLQPEELDNLVAYLKTLKAKPAAAPAESSSSDGESQFVALCGRCHIGGSRSSAPGGDLKGLWDRGTLKDGSQLTDRRIARLLEEPHGNAPSFKDWLTQPALSALLDYLRTRK